MRILWCRRGLISHGVPLWGLLLGWSAIGLGAAPPARPESRADSLGAPTARVVLKDRAEIRETLERLSRRSRENRTMIRTWSGRYKVQDRMRIPAESGSRRLDRSTEDAEETPAQLEQTQADFHFMLEGDGRTKRYTETRILRREVLQPVSAAQESTGALLHQRTLLLDDSFYSFEPNVQTGLVRFSDDPQASRKQAEILVRAEDMGRAAFRDPPPPPGMPWGQNINPVDCLGLGMFPDEVLQGILEFYRQQETGTLPELPTGIPDDPFMVERLTFAGDVIHHRVTIQGAPASGARKSMVNELLFDSRAGDLCTSNEIHENTQPRRTLKLVYRAHDGGVMLPENITYLEPTRDGKKIHFHRIMELQETEVNHPLPADAFSLSALGMENGERMVDRIDKRVRVYRDGSLVEMSDPPSMANSGYDLTHLIIVAVNALLIGIAFTYWMGHRRRVVKPLALANPRRIDQQGTPDTP